MKNVVEVSAAKFLEDVAAHGGHFLVGEYRGSAVSLVDYLDKESGKKASYTKVMHSIETHTDTGLEAVHLQEMLDRLTIRTPEEYKAQCWLQPGMRVVVTPRRLDVDKGVKKFSCTSADIAVLGSGSAVPEKGGKH